MAPITKENMNIYNRNQVTEMCEVLKFNIVIFMTATLTNNNH